jgi:hypothetical protein
MRSQSPDMADMSGKQNLINGGAVFVDHGCRMLVAEERYGTVFRISSRISLMAFVTCQEWTGVSGHRI